MAERGRDLKFSILSDAGKFDLSDAARDLEDLGDSARDAGGDLDRFATDTKGSAGRVETALESLSRQGGRRLETLEDTARTVARKVDDSFDAIAKASRTTSRKVDDDTDTMKRSLNDVGDEASSTAREMGASFGSAGDIADGMQELAANAGEYFGPIGTALGVAGAIGIGLFRAQAEKLKEMTADIVADLIEAGGKLNDAAIDARVQTMATEDPGGFVKFNDAAKNLGISIRDVARARAGDAEAAARVITALDELDEAQRKESDAAGGVIAQRSRASEALGGLRSELGLTAEAMALAEDATDTYAAATGDAATTAETAAATAGGAWDDLRANLGRPIKARVIANAPSRSELAQVRDSIAQRIGSIPVPLRVTGQSQYANTANNSRYRW